MSSGILTGSSGVYRRRVARGVSIGDERDTRAVERYIRIDGDMEDMVSPMIPAARATDARVVERYIAIDGGTEDMVSPMVQM